MLSFLLIFVYKPIVVFFQLSPI